MGFPRRLLTEGEEIVRYLRPHWIALVGPAAVVVAVAVAWIFLLPKIPGTGRGHDILFWLTIAAGAILLLFFALKRFIDWITSEFVVTNERLIHRQGFIAKSSVEIPLERINDVRFNQSIFERIIGSGDLMIESAGERGQQRFTNVRGPEGLQKTIYEQAEIRNLHVESGGQPPDAPSVTEELARLADLRDRGVLTEEEFRAQKARLLGGG
ncbi:MAG: PH domain-containing protein [Actinobacteria bacterium]|nr:PH domain-containing protein [Actinomycetota bacterium]